MHAHLIVTDLRLMDDVVSAKDVSRQSSSGFPSEGSEVKVRNVKTMGGEVDVVGLTETEPNLLIISYSLSANTGIETGVR